MYEDFWSLTQGILFRKNALRLLMELRRGPRRFTDLYRLFGSPVTLSLRLSELQKLGLIDASLSKTEELGRIKNGVNYGLTKKGQEVAEIFIDLQSKLSDKMKQWQDGDA